MNVEFYIAIVGEIFDGYSEMLYKQETVFVKHSSLKDQQVLDVYYQHYYRIAKKKGVNTEKEALKILCENDLWSRERNENIKRLKDERDSLLETSQSLPLPSQRIKIKNEANKLGAKIAKIEGEKNELIGITAEGWASNRSQEHLLQSFIYKNPELTELYHSPESFNDLEVEELIDVMTLRNELYDRLLDKYLQKAVLLPFFSLYLPLCEDVNGFFGKPIINLTIPQLKLTTYGKVFHSIFQYVDDIPDNIREDPDKLLSFSEAQRNKGKKSQGVNLKEDADASMLFGATKEDMKSVAGKEGIALGDILKEKGGSLNMEDMMKLSGV